MKILFCGDVVINGVAPCVSDAVRQIFQQADYRICNFEGPILSENSAKIVKAGPHVRNDRLAIEFLKTIGINCAALANNHIMDYGVSSLTETIDILHQNNISSVGAGCSFDTAYHPLIIHHGDEQICLINACQAEFGVLKNRYYNRNSSGYAWINCSLIRELLLKYKNNCNKVILFIHAGMEEQIAPLPEWKQLYHEFADILQGNGAIIATHPHIVQGFEIYNKTPIYFSLGNFAFYKDELRENREWNRSLLVEYDTKTNLTRFFPVSINGLTIDLDNSDDFKSNIKYRCDIISNDHLMNDIADEIAEKAWNDFYKSYYLNLNNKKDITDYSIYELLKYLIKYILCKLFHKTYSYPEYEFNETMLLHNIQIESHRFCVERYLYKKNLRTNNFF